MNFIAALFIPFFYFSLSNFTTCILLKNKFGNCLPITFMGNIIVVYLSQLFFGSFNPGFIILIVYALLSIFLIILNKDKNNITKYLITNGFISFVIFYILSFIICYKKRYIEYDEVMHWGVMVKEMIRTGKFYSDNISTMMYHKDYPPFVSLFQLIWCNLTLGYSEWAPTMALHTFIFSLALHHLFENGDSIKGKTVLRNLIISLIIFTVILHFDVIDLFSSIYLEAFLPTIFSYCFFLIIKKEQSLINNLAVLLSCITLIMSKQIGIAFIGLIFLTYFLKNICFNKEEKKYKYLLYMVIAAIFIGTFYWSWSNYISQFPIEKQFSLDNIADIKEVFGTDEYGKKVTKLFIKALFELEVSNNILKLSYIGCTVLFFLIVFILSNYIKRNKKSEKKRNLQIALIVFIVGTIFYAIMMLFLYLFIFVPSETMKLASFARYMSSYITAEFLSLLLMYIDTINRRFKTKDLIIILLLLLVTLNNISLRNFIPYRTKELRWKYYEDEAKIINAKVPANSKVFVVANSKASHAVIIHYYSCDKYFAFTWDDYLNADYENPKIREAFDKQLFEYDYLFISDLSNKFINNYKNYLVGNSSFKSHTVYKITKDKKLIECS